MKTPVFLQKLARAVCESRLLRRGDTLLVGVSGGPDSMALLAVLENLSKKQRWKMTALHVHHMLRGKSSDADERFVRDWTRRMGIDLVVQKADVPAHRKSTGAGVEEAARALRYRALEKTALDIEADKIVLAHTADDQAETLLWRLLRGSLGGLAGIPAKRPSALSPGVTIVRPFLSVRKREILAFLKEQKIPYRRDLSNRDNRFTRNKIRNVLIPHLQKHFNPGIVRVLNATAQNLRHQRDLIESLTQTTWNRGIVQTDGTRKIVKVSALRKLPRALQGEVFKKALEAAEADLSKLRHQDVQRLIDLTNNVPSSKQAKIGPVRIRREQDAIVLDPAEIPQRTSPKVVLKIPGRNVFAGGVLQTKLEKPRGKISFAAGRPGRYKECFDWDKLTPPIALRSRRPADRYQPIGLKGNKKVKDILIEEKIPRSMRGQVPLLVDASGKILWLAGYRIAEFCKIRPDTRNILAVEAKLDWKNRPDATTI